MHIRTILMPIGLAVAFAVVCWGLPAAGVENPPRRPIDEGKAAAVGIRKVASKRLTLYTDLPKGPEIDSLPKVFDLAFPQICEYFKIRPESMPDWSMTGFLIKDRKKFTTTGLLPDNVPNFLHGYCINHELWLYEQPSDYYRRHLLIHEGIHGFMKTRLGSCGPPWYMEGMAELLATHRWQDGKLTLGYMPQTREEVPEWGRIRIIKDAMEAKHGKRLKTVIEFPPIDYLETETYAWSWAAASFLDVHPRYRERFRGLSAQVREKDFSARFFRLFEADWPEVCEEWQVFVANIEYGYDLSRAATTYAPGKPITGDSAKATIRADRGWQSTGILLDAGVRHTIRASGRYQVGQEPAPWWCEPGGVSIRYYQGRPLGVLLGAVHPDAMKPDSISPLLHPVVIGLGATLTPDQAGTLYLKVNQSAARLEDNAGELQVEVKR